MEKDITYLHIKRAIESGKECFLCVLEDEIERKYMGTYLYELVMDPSSRHKTVENRGFCNHHFYKLLFAAARPESSDNHGLALIMENVTDELIQDLRQKRFNKMLANETQCQACIHLSDFMEMYAKTVVDLLSSNHEEFSKLFQQSKGLCIPHFVTLIHGSENAVGNRGRRTIETLEEIEKKNLQRLNSELAEYIRRQSYEFSEKDRVALEDVVLRSVEKISGRRGVRLS